MSDSRSRRRLDVITEQPFPAYGVWELTLACDHACTHCGSRAGVARDGELSSAEALGVVDQLAALGTREVVLIGGEASLHAGFLAIISAEPLDAPDDARAPGRLVQIRRISASQPVAARAGDRPDRSPT